MNAATDPLPPAQSSAQRIAAWAMGLRYAQAPAQVRQALRNCLLYNLAMALAVDADEDEAGSVLAAVADTPGRSRLFNGRGARSAEDAAFLNAGLITARGQNDTHPDVVAHVGCIVVPAVLAVADERGCAFQDVLDAMLAGYEIIPRLARGLATESSRRGFRATSVYGVIGAAVACARLMGLSAAQAANALSIATHCSSGLMQTWVDGSQEWRLQVARASRDGVLAARLAAAGMQGSPGCLDGQSGLASAFAGRPFTLDLSGWRIPEITFKPYPGCAFNQAPVHALRLLLQHRGLDPSQVVRLAVFMHPLDAGYPGVSAHGPFASPAGAIMSAPFMLAATLHDDLPRAAHFGQQFGHGPLHARSRMVSVYASDTVGRWMCRLELAMADGTVHTAELAEPGSFIFDWDGTVALTAALAEEWPGPSPAARHRALVRAVAGLAVRADGRALQSAIYCAGPTGDD